MHLNKPLFYCLAEASRFQFTSFLLYFRRQKQFWGEILFPSPAFPNKKKRHPYERDDAYARGSTLLPSDNKLSDEAQGRLTHRMTSADCPR